MNTFNLEESNESIGLENVPEENLEFVSGGVGGLYKNNKCINWQCKACSRKATDPFYAGGMHDEGCKYRGIVGCKVCMHYVKGVKCEFASSGDVK